jgi:hypothetical protein
MTAKGHPPASTCFKKGDPRCNRKGQVSADTVRLSADIKGFLTSIGGELSVRRPTCSFAESVARTLWERAENGDVRAVEIIFERIMGKPKENEGQPIPVLYKIEYVAEDPAPDDAGENKRP